MCEETKYPGSPESEEEAQHRDEQLMAAIERIRNRGKRASTPEPIPENQSAK